MNRVRVCGEINNRYEQVVELSNEELQELRNDLNNTKKKGDQAINDFLGESYGDTAPIDWECGEWSAELIDNNDLTIESLDAKN